MNLDQDFRRWLEAHNFQPDTMHANELHFARACYEAQRKPAPAPATPKVVQVGPRIDQAGPRIESEGAR